MSIPPDHLIAKKKGNKYLNVPHKYKPCEALGCNVYIMCPFVRCNKCRTDMASDLGDVTEWSGCDCNGKYNTETYKCAVCVVK